MATLTWTKDAIDKIASTDDLHVAPFRDDGKTYGTPTWIWSVVVEGALYVRAYNGVASRWYQAAQRQRAGRIRVAGMTKDVVFEVVDPAMNDQIDAAYRAKYGGNVYLASMTSARAQAATMRISPRAA